MLFYGRMLGMSKQEILITDYSEMSDMIACYAIYNGAEEKTHKRALSFDDAMKLR